MKTTEYPITVRDLYAGFVERDDADSHHRAWTNPGTDLRPQGTEHPDGFFHDYGGGIVLLLFLLWAVVDEIVRRRRKTSTDS